MARSLSEFEAEQGQKPETTDQTPPPAEGKPVVKEAVVVIDGKERPLKNYEAELRRKADEEKDKLRQEYEQKLLSLQQQANTVAPPQKSWYDVVQEKAEQEMAYTGKAVPLNTILEVANSLYKKNVESVLVTKDNAEKEIRTFKRAIRKEHDFADIEDDFDALVDNLKPEQINQATLEVILNSVRGRRVNELVKKAEERGRQGAEKDTQILGAPVETQSSGTPPKTTLTSAQQAELSEMNKENTMEWTEAEYLDALSKKQNRFLAQGAKNKPELLKDKLSK